MARVLIVEDEAEIRATLARCLEEAGNEVCTAADAAQVKTLMRDHDFDVVVSDIVMPCQVGVQFLRGRWSRNTAVQFVLVTGEPTLDAATQALRLGAFDCLPKPVHPEALCRMVAKAAHEKVLRHDNGWLDAENQRHREELEILVADRTRELREAVEQREAALGPLKRILWHMTGALSLAIEKRDPYTAGHQRRVAAIAGAVAREMDLDPDRVVGLELGATIHDIGKIAVPSEILSKPARLNAMEFELIKTHTTAGAEIIQDIEFPWPVRDIVLSHHERMDGSGYPHGLEGARISMEARIVAVADVVEAMASHRPYRPALGVEAGLAEIEDKAGAHFDPHVVAACVRLFREQGFRIPDAT